MWIGDQIFLALVIAAFAVFIGGLGFASWYSGRKPGRGGGAKGSAEAGAKPLKKAA